MPVVIEEYSFASHDPQKVADGQERIVLGTIGHAAGWLNWYMQYPRNPNQADTPERSAILNDDMTPTPWGLRAKALIRKLQSADLSRKPAASTIDLDRERELVPKTMGTELLIRQNWSDHPHPIDFRWPRNKWIQLRLEGEK